MYICEQYTHMYYTYILHVVDCIYTYKYVYHIYTYRYTHIYICIYTYMHALHTNTNIIRNSYYLSLYVCVKDRF